MWKQVKVFRYFSCNKNTREYKLPYTEENNEQTNVWYKELVIEWQTEKKIISKQIKQYWAYIYMSVIT